MTPEEAEAKARDDVIGAASAWHDAASAYEKRLDVRWTDSDRRQGLEGAEQAREKFDAALDRYRDAIELRVKAVELSGRVASDDRPHDTEE